MSVTISAVASLSPQANEGLPVLAAEGGTLGSIEESINNIFDPLRAGVMVRTDVCFFEEVPGYPRLMVGRAPQVEAKADGRFF